jgi:hypothetical protein
MSKKTAISMTLFTLLISTAVIYFFWRSSVLNKEGVYVLGIVTHKDRPTRGGIHYRGQFAFKGEQYDVEFTKDGERWHPGSLFFVRVAAGHPKVNISLVHEPVPRCLTLASVPADGWKVLPGYCNNPCGQPIRFSQMKEFQFIENNIIGVNLLHIYSFHGGCSLRNDTLYANVFKCVEVNSRDTLLVFSLCTHPYDFVNVEFTEITFPTIRMNDRTLQHPDVVFTALEDGDISPNYQYIVADLSHYLGIE